MRTIPRGLTEDKTYSVNYVVYLNENDEKAYCFVAVRTEKLASFKAALLEGDFDTEDFGITLDEGLGEADEPTWERMRMLYQCDDTKAYSLISEVESE